MSTAGASVKSFIASIDITIVMNIAILLYLITSGLPPVPAIAVAALVYVMNTPIWQSAVVANWEKFKTRITA